MSQPDAKGKPRVSNWTVQQDRVLLNLLLDQFKRNYCNEGTFKSHVWTDILVSFNEATRLNLNQTHLQNRWKNLKRTYHLYETLRSRSGWGWDESRQLPIAPDQNAWTAAIASNSRYATIMGKPYMFREEMDILCAKTTCRGRLSFGSNQDIDLEHTRSFGDEDSPRQQFSSMGLQSNLTPTEEGESFDPFFNYPPTQPSVNFGVGGSQTSPPVGGSQTSPVVPGLESRPVDCQFEDEATSPRKRSVTPSSSTRNRKRKGKIDTSTIHEYCALSRERLDLAKLFMTTPSSGPPTTQEEYTVKECLKKLKTLPGCVPAILYHAANLFKHADNRVVFMALDDEDKLGWIIHNGM